MKRDYEKIKTVEDAMKLLGNNDGQFKPILDRFIEDLRAYVPEAMQEKDAHGEDIYYAVIIRGTDGSVVAMDIDGNIRVEVGCLPFGFTPIETKH